HFPSRRRALWTWWLLSWRSSSSAKAGQPSWRPAPEFPQHRCWRRPMPNWPCRPTFPKCRYEVQHPDRRGIHTGEVHPMISAARAKLLEPKRGLIVGIANDQSIAWGCAKAFRALGAELAVTYLNDKARKYVEPLACELEAP